MSGGLSGKFSQERLLRWALKDIEKFAKWEQKKKRGGIMVLREEPWIWRESLVRVAAPPPTDGLYDFE